MTAAYIGSLATNSAHFGSAIWGDYDNDGFLDLFVSVNGGKACLYHNNGDGSFVQILTRKHRQ